MKGEIVPDEDHVTRLCGGSHVREDGSIAATAFKLRPGEAYLSVNWLEVLGLPTRQAATEEVRRVLATKRTVGSTARLAMLNVGRSRDVARQGGIAQVNLVFRHEPEIDPGRPRDVSHTGLYGVPTDDNTIPELLAASVLEIIPAR